MTKKDFISKCVDKGWLWAEDNDKLYIKLKNERVVEVDNQWEKYGERLLKHIGSYDVIQMTRIVGYYSKVSNWNKSKIGELKDRHGGAYSI